MRTTVNIDDAILRELREEARRADVPLRALLERTIRAGLTVLHAPAHASPYRCKTFGMGYPPRFSLALDKALSVAAELEDEEIGRKLALRK